MKPIFFKTPAELRSWFEKHHESGLELMVGFYKVGTGKPSVTWPEAVDEALCFGWIDGVRRSLGEDAYVIRFTPRKPKSYWSSVNIRKAELQVAKGRMHPKGLAAFALRDASGERRYSFENRAQDLAEPYLAKLREHPKAAAFHEAKAPSYKKAAAFWVMSAKAEETRLRRLQQLIDQAERGETIRQLTPPAKRPGAAKKEAAPKPAKGKTKQAAPKAKKAAAKRSLPK